METEKIYGRLTEIFQAVFGRDDIVLSPGMTAKDIDGWDSFRQIEIITVCEEKFGFTFRTREIDSLRSVGDLVDLIGRRA